MTPNEIYKAAGLTEYMIQLMPRYLAGIDEFYDTPACNKLYDYFAFEVCTMPYEVAKARTECPDEWILKQVINENR